MHDDHSDGNDHDYGNNETKNRNRNDDGIVTQMGRFACRWLRVGINMMSTLTAYLAPYTTLVP